VCVCKCVLVVNDVSMYIVSRVQCRVLLSLCVASVVAGAFSLRICESCHAALDCHTNDLLRGSHVLSAVTQFEVFAQTCSAWGLRRDSLQTCMFMRRFRKVLW